ncbi:MAG: SRPBCC domain-containing protein [Pseudorhodoplanes sp.]|nr:SRPBCC domain-containing protein [Pseudorhodoplanes sp.]
MDSPVEFSLTRTLDAPRELVWKAFTQADSLAQWWGPKGARIKVLKLDMRVGGIFHYSMEFQPGQPMYGRFTYYEIVAPKRLVYVSSFADESGEIVRAPFPQLRDSWPLEVLNTVRFTEESGRTTVSLRGHPINATEAEMKTYVGMFESMQHGFGGTFDKLDTYLAQEKVA